MCPKMLAYRHHHHPNLAPLFECGIPSPQEALCSWQKKIRYMVSQHSDTVDGSEIRRAPVDMLKLSHSLRRVLYMPGGCWGFLSINCNFLLAAEIPGIVKHQTDSWNDYHDLCEKPTAVNRTQVNATHDYRQPVYLEKNEALLFFSQQKLSSWSKTTSTLTPSWRLFDWSPKCLSHFKHPCPKKHPKKSSFFSAKGSATAQANGERRVTGLTMAPSWTRDGTDDARGSKHQKWLQGAKDSWEKMLLSRLHIDTPQV